MTPPDIRHPDPPKHDLSHVSLLPVVQLTV